jgi:lysozyme
MARRTTIRACSVFKIEAGVTITPEQCESLLRSSLKMRYEPAVDKAIGPGKTQPQYDAGYSFHYNTGAIARASWVKNLFANHIAAVQPGIMQWNKGGGKVLAGLTRRRNREWEMISTGDYGPEGRQVPRDLHTGAPVNVPSPDHPAPQEPSTDHPAGTNNPSYPGMMHLGDNGPEVKDEQEQLIDCGWTDVKPTSTYDSATEKAVRAFQQAHPQLRADGILGPATKVTLRRDADAKRKLKNAAGASTGVGGAGTGLDQVTGGHVPWEIYAGGALIAALIIGYIAWTYRDEIRGWLLSKAA